MVLCPQGTCVHTGHSQEFPRLPDSRSLRPCIPGSSQALSPAGIQDSGSRTTGDTFSPQTSQASTSLAAAGSAEASPGSLGTHRGSVPGPPSSGDWILVASLAQGRATLSLSLSLCSGCVCLCPPTHPEDGPRRGKGYTVPALKPCSRVCHHCLSPGSHQKGVGGTLDTVNPGGMLSTSLGGKQHPAKYQGEEGWPGTKRLLPAVSGARPPQTGSRDSWESRAG